MRFAMCTARSAGNPRGKPLGAASSELMAIGRASYGIARFLPPRAPLHPSLTHLANNSSVYLCAGPAHTVAGRYPGAMAPKRRNTSSAMSRTALRACQSRPGSRAPAGEEAGATEGLTQGRECHQDASERRHEHLEGGGAGWLRNRHSSAGKEGDGGRSASAVWSHTTGMAADRQAASTASIRWTTCPRPRASGITNTFASQGVRAGRSSKSWTTRLAVPIGSPSTSRTKDSLGNKCSTWRHGRCHIVMPTQSLPQAKAGVGIHVFSLCW